MPRLFAAFVLFLCVSLAGCASDGHINVLGYTTRPPYDPNIKTVYVTIFGNTTYLRGLEQEMTKAIIRDIEYRTPYKVVSTPEEADTELTGKIITRRKTPNNINQLGEVRDVEVGLAVEVYWKDLRSGEYLSSRNDPNRPREPSDPKPPPVIITPAASYIPELGGTTTSALDAVCKQTARQITHLMETWNTKCEP